VNDEVIMVDHCIALDTQTWTPSCSRFAVQVNAEELRGC
jgi:hypothetical protein